MQVIDYTLNLRVRWSVKHFEYIDRCTKRNARYSFCWYKSFINISQIDTIEFRARTRTRVYDLHSISGNGSDTCVAYKRFLSVLTFPYNVCLEQKVRIKHKSQGLCSVHGLLSALGLCVQLVFFLFFNIYKIDLVIWSTLTSAE